MVNAPVALPAPEGPLASCAGFVDYLAALTEKGYLTLDEVAANIYSETEAHRELVRQLRQTAQSESLEEACLEVLGETLNPTPGYAPLRAEMSGISLIQESDRRGSARVVDRTWKLHELSLVEYDGRWWISGYTWDGAQQPELMKSFVEHPKAGQAAAEMGPPFAARVHAREFRDIDAARAAFRRALQDYVLTHP